MPRGLIPVQCKYWAYAKSVDILFVENTPHTRRIYNNISLPAVYVVLKALDKHRVAALALFDSSAAFDVFDHGISRPVLGSVQSHRHNLMCCGRNKQIKRHVPKILWTPSSAM